MSDKSNKIIFESLIYKLISYVFLIWFLLVLVISLAHQDNLWYFYLIIIIINLLIIVFGLQKLVLDKDEIILIKGFKKYRYKYKSISKLEIIESNHSGKSITQKFSILLYNKDYLLNKINISLVLKNSSKINNIRQKLNLECVKFIYKNQT